VGWFGTGACSEGRAEASHPRRAQCARKLLELVHVRRCVPTILLVPTSGGIDRKRSTLARLGETVNVSCTRNEKLHMQWKASRRQRRMMDSSGCGDTDTNAALGHRPGPHFNVTRGRHMGRTNDMNPLRRHRTNGGVVGMACHCRRWCRELGLHTVTGRLEPVRVCVAALDATTSLLL
jgi:hypothetical protein